MAKVLIENQVLTDIANAIRYKCPQDRLYPAQMADAIRNIDRIDINGIFDSESVMIKSWNNLMTEWGGDIANDNILRPSCVSKFIPENAELLIVPGVEKIGAYMFYAYMSGSYLKKLIIREGCKTIGERAFENQKLISVYLPSTITYMHGLVFNGCNDLTDIYVPWSEGVVAYKPWGAPTTCTIHYNYKGK